MSEQPPTPQVGTALILPIRGRWGSAMLWALGIAQAVGVLSGLAGEWLGVPWRRFLGDALFVEGAALLVLAGLLDLTRSVTASHIRARPRIGDPPPAIRRTGRAYVLVIAGLLLCLEGALLAHVFSSHGG